MQQPKKNHMETMNRQQKTLDISIEGYV